MTTTTRSVLVLATLLAGVVAVGLVFLSGSRPVGPEGTDPIGKDGASRRRRADFGGDGGTAALVGTVRRADTEEPAVGERVRLASGSGPAREVRTDGAGRFRLDGLAPGKAFALLVDAEGFAPVRVPGIVLDAGETRDVGFLDLAPAVAVVVAVRDEADEPLPGATVEAHVVPEWRRVDWQQRVAQLAAVPVPVASAVSGADGRVRLEGLAVGRWTFVASKKGYAAGGRTRVELRADLEPEEIVVRLRPGYPLRGRVRDGEGRPLPGATVLAMAPGRLYSLEFASLHGRAESDEEGGYGFEALPAGHAILYVSLGGWAPIPVAAVKIPEIDRLDLVVRLGGSLSGVVHAEETDEPIPNAKVRTWSQSELGGLSVEAVADDRGRYEFARLPASQVTGLYVEAEGWVQVTEVSGFPLRVLAGESAVRDLVMTRGATLTGRVTTPEGPVPDARVVAWVVGNVGWPVQRPGRTDAEGRYEIRTIGGDASLEIRASGYYQPDAPANWLEAIRGGTVPERYRVEIPSEGEATLDVEISAGIPVEGRVEGPEGEAIAGARVTMGGASTLSGPDGTFGLAVPPRDGLVLFAAKEGLLTREPKRVDVRPGEPVRDLVLRLEPALRIHGRIGSSTGKPLAGGRVELWSGAYRPRPFDVRSSGNDRGVPVAADGTYEAFGWRSTGRVGIRATAIGHAAKVSPPVEIVPGMEGYQIDLTLDLGEELHGRVTSNGAPVPGARIGADPVGRNPGASFVGNRPGRAVATVAVSGENGSFTVSHLTPGAYEVVVRAEGHVEARVRASVPGAGVLEVPLQSALSITGRVVYGDGAPAPGVYLWAQAVRADGRPDGRSGRTATAAAGADGGFTLPDLGPGKYVVTAQAPYRTRDLNVKTVRSDPVEPGGEPLRIVVERGESIAGRVVDEDGRPVPGAQITAQLGEGRGALQFTTTNGHGRFRLVGLEPGAHRITAAPAQTRFGTRQPVTREGVPTGTEDLEIALPGALEIAGIVEDESGRPLTKGTIEAQPLPGAGGRRPERRSQPVRLDTNGAFRIGGLAAGRYRLKLTIPQGRTADSGWVLRGGDEVEAGRTDLRLTASRGLSISGRVTANGRPLQGVYVWAFEEGMGGTRFSVRSDARGRFEVQGLREGGRYRVRVQAQDHQAIDRNGILAGATGLTFALVQGLRVAGRLLAADGTPVPRANLYFSQGTKNAWGRTNEQGEFSVGGLGEGTWTVRAWFQGAPGMVEAGTIEAGSSGIDLRLGR